MTQNVHVFGIRHHGPGSARSLREALEALQPDAILVEGPPDGDSMLPLMIHAEMQPPVALLIYAPDQPQHAVYYPFAIFSPEWQALTYGLSHNVHTRFMDLPQTHQFGILEQELEKAILDLSEQQPPQPGETPDDGSVDHAVPLPEGAGPPSPEDAPDPTEEVRGDPLRFLAEVAGYSDSERWWEHMVEHRHDSTDLFAAILEMMTALRDSVPPTTDRIEILREAHMRKTIRAAQKDGYQRIAVVCGAWHSPALVTMPSAKTDDDLLKGLPKAKVQATWVPWTHGRLARQSGYGAGIESPGWYHHLWTEKDEVAIRWMTKVAGLLRGEDLDASTAQVIDAVRLAESLAALRDRPLPGLPELNEATQATLCFGGDMPMRLIHTKLIVGEALGEVSDETPMVPLQQDLQRELRRLRMPAKAEEKEYKLDLREPTDLDRSHLLHRLTLLGVEWGKRARAGKAKGTFWEAWKLKWQPELSLTLIEASIWGTTIREASTAFTRDKADNAPDLPTLTKLLDTVLLADLPEAASHLMQRIQDEAAVASDIGHLMDALPPLANILRYGNVRGTDAGMVGTVVDGLVARVNVGLPGACASLDDAAAGDMFKRLMAVNGAISLLQNDAYLTDWRDTLLHMADQAGIHGLLAGRCCRILLDGDVLDREEAARRLGLALSTASEPPDAAHWVDGFLRGSGLVLLHDDKLWQVLDDWVAALKPDAFNVLMPLLRRTFSTFPAPERHQMGERARRGPVKLADLAAESDFDSGRAESILPTVARLLGF